MVLCEYLKAEAKVPGAVEDGREAFPQSLQQETSPIDMLPADSPPELLKWNSGWLPTRDRRALVGSPTGSC